MLQSMGLQRVGHDLVTEQQQSPIYLLFLLSFSTCHIRHGVGVPFWAFGATTRFVKSHTHAQTLTNIEWAPYCWNLCLSQLSNFMAQYSHLLATSLYACVSISVIRNSQLGLMWRWMRWWNVDSAWLRVSVHMWLMMRRRDFTIQQHSGTVERKKGSFVWVMIMCSSRFLPMRPSHPSLGTGITS